MVLFLLLTAVPMRRVVITASAGHGVVVCLVNGVIQQILEFTLVRMHIASMIPNVTDAGNALDHVAGRKQIVNILKLILQKL